MGVVMLDTVSGAAEKGLTLSDKLGYILNTALVGYLLVFAVLAVIWGIIEIFGKVLHRKDKTDVSAEQKVVADTVTETEETETKNDEELVAVIAAAISAYTEKPLSSFRVVSFRKNNN